MKNTAPRRAFSLIEMLVVIVIIAVIAAVMMPRIAGHGRTKDGKATTPMSKARDTECLMNLTQVKQGIEVFKATAEGTPPQSLDDLKLPKELLSCAVSKQPYQYDPQTGAVRCTFPGHTSQ